MEKQNFRIWHLFKLIWFIYHSLQFFDFILTCHNYELFMQTKRNFTCLPVERHIKDIFCIHGTQKIPISNYYLLLLLMMFFSLFNENKWELCSRVGWNWNFCLQRRKYLSSNIFKVTFLQDWFCGEKLIVCWKACGLPYACVWIILPICIRDEFSHLGNIQV